MANTFCLYDFFIFKKRSKAGKAEEKKKVLEERVPAFPDVETLDEEALKQLCRDLHGKLDAMKLIQMENPF